MQNTPSLDTLHVHMQHTAFTTETHPHSRDTQNTTQRTQLAHAIDGNTYTTHDICTQIAAVDNVRSYTICTNNHNAQTQTHTITHST